MCGCQPSHSRSWHGAAEEVLLMFTDPVGRTWRTRLQRCLACGKGIVGCLRTPERYVEEAHRVSTVWGLYYQRTHKQTGFSEQDESECSVEYFCLSCCRFPHHASGIHHQHPSSLPPNAPHPPGYLSYYIIKLQLRPNWKHDRCNWKLFMYICLSCRLASKRGQLLS